MRLGQTKKNRLVFYFLVSFVFISLSFSLILTLLNLIPQAELLGIIIYFSLGGILIFRLIEHVKKN